MFWRSWKFFLWDSNFSSQALTEFWINSLFFHKKEKSNRIIIILCFLLFALFKIQNYIYFFVLILKDWALKLMNTWTRVTLDREGVGAHCECKRCTGQEGGGSLKIVFVSGSAGAWVFGAFRLGAPVFGSNFFVFSLFLVQFLSCLQSDWKLDLDDLTKLANLENELRGKINFHSW